jgi:hypothetical protein
MVWARRAQRQQPRRWGNGPSDGPIVTADEAMIAAARKAKIKVRRI